MSDKAAAIKATFSDWRTVKSRKQLQLIFEVPLEQQVEVLNMLGAPMPDSPMWVGIARIQNVEQIKPHQEKRRWENLMSAVQAGLRCTEPAFWRFMNDEIMLSDVWDEDSAASCVRQYCGVGSRSALNLDPKAAAKWQELDARYMLWLREPQHA